MTTLQEIRNVGSLGRGARAWAKARSLDPLRKGADASTPYGLSE